MASPLNRSLLLCATPKDWLEQANSNLETLLLDQANCEKKAAATAVSLLHRRSDDASFTLSLSRIAREELTHLEQVTKVLHGRSIAMRNLSASRYAASLHDWMNKREPQRFVDQLLVCAMIEARSCERIEALLPYLDVELEALYDKLHEAEDRHLEFYFGKAWQINAGYCENRLNSLCLRDAELVTQADDQFRFHSGCPVQP